MKDGETIKELKANLKKANNELKERSLLLDMYKTVTKETRDKVGLMAAEKKARGDLDEARYEYRIPAVGGDWRIINCCSGSN